MTTEESFQLKTYKFDINIKEGEYHASNGLDAHWLTLLFSGKDFNIKIANTLRRVASVNVPIYALPPELINIDINTATAFNNDYMRLRLSQLPVYGVDPEIFFLHEKYWNKINYADTKRDKHANEKVIEYYINYHNNTQSVVSVTTNDLIINVDGNQIQPYSEKYPILLIKLRPNDKFKCHMRAALGVGEKNVIWNAARNCYYDENNETYEITIEGNDQFNEYELMIRSCKYLMKKLSDLKDFLNEMIASKQIIPEKKIHLKLDSEDHTLGELLNDHFQNHDDIAASGLSKPDYLIKSMLIKVTAVAKIDSPLNAMLETIDMLIKKMSHIGKLLHDMAPESGTKKKPKK